MGKAFAIRFSNMPTPLPTTTSPLNPPKREKIQGSGAAGCSLLPRCDSGGHSLLLNFHHPWPGSAVVLPVQFFTDRWSKKVFELTEILGQITRGLHWGIATSCHYSRALLTVSQHVTAQTRSSTAPLARPTPIIPWCLWSDNVDALNFLTISDVDPSGYMWTRIESSWHDSSTNTLSSIIFEHATAS